MNARQGFIGQAVKRREDGRFLTGTGQYTDDITLHGQTYGVFLRSPHAHATIVSLSTTAAATAPGVLGIYTGEHFKAVGGLPCGWLINNIDGTPMKEPKHPVLADGKVRYVGDRVALVVAETQAQRSPLSKAWPRPTAACTRCRPPSTSATACNAASVRRAG